MIRYVNGSELSDLEIFKAFSIGYSDYMIKFEMSQDDFIKRFFGPEGNERILTTVALDDQKSVGLIMGGIRSFNGVRTMRCGTLCIAPEYRGKAISQQLMHIHMEMAKEAKCPQMMLEVIAGNDRAIKFYERANYKKVYEILYYSLKNQMVTSKSAHDIQLISEKDLELLIATNHFGSINWQNDFEYVKAVSNVVYFGSRDENGELIGLVTIDKMGKIYQLWVKPKHRFRGVASAMIAHAQRTLSLEMLHISFISNSDIMGFLSAHGFKPLEIYQYEMFKWLTLT